MLRRLGGRLRLLSASPKKVRAVILGHQKSGTTAIAALLSAATAQEMSNDPLYEVDWGAAAVAQSLVKHPEKLQSLCHKNKLLFCQPIVKDPDFIFLWPAVKECYPQARFVFIVRDPREMIRSICNRLGIPGTVNESMLSAADMKNGNRHWELVVQGLLPELASGQRGGVVTNLAWRWRRAAETYLAASEQMHLVKYEEFTADKSGMIDSLAGALGFPVRRRIDALLDRQFQPKGSSVSKEEFFGEAGVSRINEICAEPMGRLGYAL